MTSDDTSKSSGLRAAVEDPERRLLRAILRLILGAAVLTAPIFVLGEALDAKTVARVAASNGLCALSCWGLLRVLRGGRTELVANTLVFGLLALVGSLAWSNGERVHVNVINFILIAVLASTIASRRVLVVCALLSAAEMIAIAVRRPFPEAGQEAAEASFEAIIQFLPTYLVIVVVLWLRVRSRDNQQRIDAP